MELEATSKMLSILDHMTEQASKVTCSACGAAVPSETPSTPPEARKPCPNCGSVARVLGVRLTDGVDVHDTVATKARHGEPEQVKL